MNIAEYTEALKNVIPNSDLRDRVLGLTVCMMADLKEKIYVVTAVDYGDSCDGKARVLGAFKLEGDAKNYVRNDMEDMADNLMGGADEVDFDEMFVRNDDFTCEWNIEEVEVK